MQVMAGSVTYGLLLQADGASLDRMAWLGPVQQRLADAAAAPGRPADGSRRDQASLRLEVQDKASDDSHGSSRARVRGGVVTWVRADQLLLH